MGNVERGARSKRRKQYIQDAVIAALAIGGILAVAAIAPKVINLLGYTKLGSRLRYQTQSVLNRLYRKGYVAFATKDGMRFARLTELGERAFELERERTSLTTQRKRRWDGRYRLVVFDVPEKRRSARVRLRAELREVGFLRIQDSTWIYPYDCEEFISLLKADMRIGKDVLYAVVEQMENDAWIRKHFELPGP